MPVITIASSLCSSHTVSAARLMPERGDHRMRVLIRASPLARRETPLNASWEAIIKRCAIYTRKSSSEGLDRGFNSLDAQRQFCESYIASQAGEGWTALDTRYDDGGFSGGSLDRPAVRRLMADVAAGTIDTVVVYKIDRLSRSLIDFSSLIGRFEAHGVSFVAVTQAFNTTSSMGRLTLNVLLSFAQFERELASERLRDKAAASRARGLWQAGPRPFGYQVERGRLILDEGEAEAIRYAYRRYPKVGAARLLAQELTAKGIFNKTGMPFTKKSVTDLLRNRLYRGDLVHRGKSVPGVHTPIVTEKSWARVQEALADVYRIHRPFARPSVPNPLRGCLFGPLGWPLSHTFCHHRNRLHRYYIPTGIHRHGSGDHYRAADLDAAVLAAIADFIPTEVRNGQGTSDPDILRRLLSRVDIGQNEMVIVLRTGAIVRTPVVGRIRDRGSSKTDVTEAPSPAPVPDRPPRTGRSSVGIPR